MKSVLSLALIASLVTSVVPITAYARTQSTPLVEGSVVLDSDAWPHGTSSVTSGAGGEVGTARLVATGSVSAKETAVKDATYWRTYAATIPPNATVKLRFKDGKTIRGQIREMTADDILIQFKERVLAGFFTRKGLRRVRFDEIGDLSFFPAVRKAVVVTVVAATAVALVYVVHMLIRDASGHRMLKFEAP